MRHFTYHATVRHSDGRVLYQMGSSTPIPVANDRATDEQIRQEIKRILIDGQTWEMTINQVG